MLLKDFSSVNFCLGKFILKSGNCREFEMDVYDMQNRPFLKLKRDFRCTIACMNRPEMEVTYVA